MRVDLCSGQGDRVCETSGTRKTAGTAYYRKGNGVDMVDKMQERRTRVVGDESVESGRGPGQLPWYEFATTIIHGKKVLDAGCGLGRGLEILRRSNKEVWGQDLDPRLEDSGIMITPLETIPSKAYYAVTCIDVIEHVEDDKTFVAELCRIATDAVFVTTPNWTITRCEWPYHVREYTPRQLQELFEPFGTVVLFKGNSSGSIVYPVRHVSLCHVANTLRYGRYTSFLTRCINKVLPSKSRIHGHNAALLNLR